MKKIATIIVTYNGEHYLQKCLDHVLALEYSTDVFVADNHSSDQTKYILKNYENQINCTFLSENLGFGKANNLLLQLAYPQDYDYYFLVNQDLYVEPDVLSKLLDFSEENANFGISAPIQYDGSGAVVDRNFQDYIKHSKDYETHFETEFCNAAAWLISKKCLAEVGVFNPLFRHYGEDRNYCNRTLYHHFKIAIVKNTKVIHDRHQQMTAEKAISLAKIKLLTFFIDPDFSKKASTLKAFYNVFGLSKYLFKKYKTLAFSALFKEFLSLFRNQNSLELSKNKDRHKWDGQFS